MNSSEVLSREAAIGLCWTAIAVTTLLDRMGWQSGAGFAECAATQREQRIGESAGLALKWT